MSQLDKLQNRVLLFIDYNYDDSLRPTVKDIMCEWDIEDLAHRRRHQLSSLIYSQVHDPDNIEKRRP